MNTTARPDVDALVLDRIGLMQTYLRIVEAGSLSAAARQLGTTQPTVSRRLQALERALGVRLIQRSTHGLTLTPDGEHCWRRGQALLTQWLDFEGELRRQRAEPEGLLRVAVPHAFGQEQLIGPLADFLRQHGRVEVEWVLRDDVQRPAAEGYDCVLQVGALRDPSLVAVPLGAVRRVLVAAPSLIDAHGTPEAPAALASWPWLALSTYYRREVVLVGPDEQIVVVPMRPRVATNNLYALRALARAGVGVSLSSAWQVADDVAAGRLQRLLPGWHGEPLPVWLAYPQASHYPARLTRFVELARGAIREGLAPTS